MQRIQRCLIDGGRQTRVSTRFTGCWTCPCPWLPLFCGLVMCTDSLAAFTASEALTISTFLSQTAHLHSLTTFSARMQLHSSLPFFVVGRALRRVSAHPLGLEHVWRPLHLCLQLHKAYVGNTCDLHIFWLHQLNYEAMVAEWQLALGSAEQTEEGWWRRFTNSNQEAVVCSHAGLNPAWDWRYGECFSAAYCSDKKVQSISDKFFRYDDVYSSFAYNGS